MSESAVVYKCEWCSPLRNNTCLTYYFTQKLLHEFIDGMLMNSTLTITPLMVSKESKEFVEASKWDT
jgi:hypothetical protein